MGERERWKKINLSLCMIRHQITPTKLFDALLSACLLLSNIQVYMKHWNTGGTILLL